MIDFEKIGPIQMLVLGFDKDAEYRGLILDELESLTARGLIRVLDLQYVLKDTDGSLVAIEATDLSDEEAMEYGALIGALVGLGEGGVAGAIEGAEAGAIAAVEKSYGLSPADVMEIAEGLEPGEATAMLLFEHTWAAKLKQAVRSTGGYPIAQGFLTPESMIMIGEEVRAVMEAEIAIEVAEAVKGAALLDTLATLEAAEQVKIAARAEAARALIVAGLIEDAAAQQAIDALLVAGLIEEAALQEAEAVVAAAEAVTKEAHAAIDAAVDSSG